ncbi:mitoferrin-1 [Daktulosphaira vitifoliae]|uniref:mitoferrin-1 n=1 Tax=Daktulosphaira vitifoliae TaxID=58002 RepID=UPI0021AA579E|nr:mitoferrin-1 [Daktulosphaira vitifoliae]
MSFDDYESLPTSNVTDHMMAGAIAGIMEHCVMYPLDSVKTRMQAFIPNNTVGGRGISSIFIDMIKQEGYLRPIRGMGTVVIGAGPAHALYFASYEHLKQKISHQTSLSITLSSGIAGCASTIIHDAIMTPTDVVKQRLQMSNSPYNGILNCVSSVWRAEGIGAFYRSYLVQLCMNAPFQVVHFMTYEHCQNFLNPDRIYNPLYHMISGGVAGGLAAAVTTPLDVCKTLLNTQTTSVKVKGVFRAVATVYSLGGASGFFRGMVARILYQMPSTAISWTTYEFFKFVLIKKSKITDDRPSPPPPPPPPTNVGNEIIMTKTNVRCDLPVTIYSHYSVRDDGSGHPF